MKQSVFKKAALISSVVPFSLAGFNSAKAAPLIINSLDNTLWTVVHSIQYYTLPVMAIALVFLGIKLVTSGDDTSSKDVVKGWMVKILIGGVIIFGASSIAALIKSTVALG